MICDFLEPLCDFGRLTPPNWYNPTILQNTFSYLFLSGSVSIPQIQILRVPQIYLRLSFRGRIRKKRIVALLWALSFDAVQNESHIRILKRAAYEDDNITPQE